MLAPANNDVSPVSSRYRLDCAHHDALSDLECPFQLGPLDHVNLRVEAVQVVFVYERPAGDPSEIMPIERLRRAVCRLLDYYPHLTDRLQFDPDTHAPEIVGLGKGVELLEARWCGDDLLAPFDPSDEGLGRDPIFSVKHTRFACGSVALGVRLHQIICNAQGFFNLVDHLAELYRGLAECESPSLKQPPEIQSILRGQQALTSEEQKKALEFQPSSFFTDDDPRLSITSTGLDEGFPAVDSPLVGRVLRYSGEALAAIKALATDPSGQGWVSTTEALSAHLCQVIYRARLQLQAAHGEAGPRPIPGFWTSIDMRGPDRLNLPSQYFANCIYLAYTNSLHPSIAESPLWRVSKSIHDLVRQVDSETMHNTTRWIAANRDKSRLGVNFVFGQGSFIATQWCKMNMYTGNHFDVASDGEPIVPSLVSPPFSPSNQLDGLVYLLATEYSTRRAAHDSVSRPPSMDVCMSLAQPVWDLLDADEEFKQFWT